MQKLTPYLRLRVLGALEFAPGASMRDRCKTVSQMIFQDEQGQARRFSWRTIETWWTRYQKRGITQPLPRSDQGKTRKISPEEVQSALEQILPLFRDKNYNIQLLYRTGIERGLLRREQIAPNTFRRIINRYQLLVSGLDSEQKERLAFAKAHANQLWQADTLHGPTLKLGPARTPTPTFLICFIDDASRVVPHGQFYDEENTMRLLSTFEIALYKRGIPEAIYIDNGSPYASKDLQTICARIGILLLHTPVRDGAAKGKIERFFRTVREQFLVRDLTAIHSLEDLNKAFHLWLEENYHQTIHSSLKMKPIDRFGLDLPRIRFLNPDQSTAEELFFPEVTRGVLKDNTFSLYNIRYEAPHDFRNKKVQIRHAPNAFHPKPSVPPRVTLYYEGQRIGHALPLDLQANDRFPHQSQH